MINQNLLSENMMDAAEKDFNILSENASIYEAIKTMREKKVSYVLIKVSDNDKITGIITERDILYRYVFQSEGKDITLKKIMSSPVVTIRDFIGISVAIELIYTMNIRRLPIKNAEGNIIGVLTFSSMLDNILKNKGIPVLVTGNDKRMCPYCGSSFEEKEILSKHIDRMHIGSGLLEGDVRRW